MWILRYLILATRQRCNTLLDRRTRMNFDPLHGCPMHVCADKAEWDRRGKDQVAQLESELRQDIEAYHTGTGERRAIKDETIEVRPVVLEKAAAPMPPMQAFKEFLGAPALLGARAPEPAPEVEAMILPEAAPETEAAPVHTGDALVSSGVEAQAEAEPGADPTFLEELILNGLPQEDTSQNGNGMKDQGNGGAGAGGGTTDFTSGTDQSQRQLATVSPSTEVPEPAPPTEAATPKAKTTPAGKARKK